jgi:hypothetical protein
VNASGYYVGLRDGTVRLVDGSGTNRVVAQTPNPGGLAIALDGSLYIADPTLHEVRRLDPSSGTISTVAGTGTACSSSTASCGDGGQATAATLSGPSGVWVSPSGEVFIADGIRGIREVRADGTITTTPGTAGSYDVVSVAGDATGDLYAATNTSSAPDGPVPTNNADYIIDVDHASGQVNTAVGTGTSGYNGTDDPSGVEINHPGGLSVALNGRIVFADTNNHLIREYDPSSGDVIDVAGLISNGVPQGGFNDGNYAKQTEFDHPAAVTVTRGALVVVADTGNGLLRQFGPSPLPTRLGTTHGSPPSPTGQRPAPPPHTPPAHRHHRRQGRHPRRLPTNHFTRSGITTSPNGTLTLAVRVPGPGTVDVLATAWNDNLARAAIRLRPAPHRFVYARSHTRARRATVLHLRVRPTGRGRWLVRHHTYRVTLRLWISYTPSGGRPRSSGVYGVHLAQ